MRRPALFVRLSISQDFEERERGRIGSEYQGAVEEALNRLGLLPVDTTLAAGAGQHPLEGLDRARPLARARETGAEHLLVVDARLARGRVTLCRESKQPRSGPPAFWEAGSRFGGRATAGRSSLSLARAKLSSSTWTAGRARSRGGRAWTS